MSSHVDLLADVIAGALTAEHLSYYGGRGSEIAKTYYRWVLYRAWGLTAHRGWARLSIAGAPYKPPSSQAGAALGINYLREMDRDKHSSKRGFGALSESKTTICGWIQQLDHSGPAPG